MDEESSIMPENRSESIVVAGSPITVSSKYPGSTIVFASASTDSICSRLGSDARVVQTSATSASVSKGGNSRGITASGGNISGRKLGSPGIRLLMDGGVTCGVSETSVTGALKAVVSISHEGRGR